MTNTGHDARKEPQASFVMSNPQKAVDYAYRAVHLTAVTAKKIAARVLRQARRPRLLELVLERRPAGPHRGPTLPRRLRRHRRQRAMGRSDRLHDRRDVEPAGAGRRADSAREARACRRARDGEVRQGRRTGRRPHRRPPRCEFDPARDVPACAAGADSPQCLTAAQAATFKKIYDGPSSGGRPYFPGFMPAAKPSAPGQTEPRRVAGST